MPSNWDKINTASDVVRLLELVCNSIRIVFAPAMHAARRGLYLTQHRHPFGLHNIIKPMHRRDLTWDQSSHPICTTLSYLMHLKEKWCCEQIKAQGCAGGKNKQRTYKPSMRQTCHQPAIYTEALFLTSVMAGG